MLDLVLPQRCVVCGKRGTQLCSACLSRLPRIEPPLCERCGAPTAWPVRRCRDCAGRRLAFASARGAVHYDDAVRAFIAAWKERALRRLAAAAVSVVIEVVPPPKVEVVTFVPPDPDRGLKRGHHPSRQLAELLAAQWGLPVASPLRRRRAAKRQRGLSRAERRRNVAGIFAVKGPVASSVALVDDVFTSGATANAAASALRKAGARRVEIVTFARVVR
ncbi:MAG: ComF family protein [Actinobacteria bacterium]|nr:MAG: ComF family protein [Actinomycetota bacterium]